MKLGFGLRDAYAIQCRVKGTAGKWLSRAIMDASHNRRFATPPIVRE